MPSPFPGMDPFLEGYLWSDVHQRLANQISAQLSPRLSPRYVARLAISVVEDEGEAEISVLHPDVEILGTARKKSARKTRESAVTYQHSSGLQATPWIVLPELRKYRQVSVEIRDAGKNELVTSIELLSPVNKREPGLKKYRAQRRRLFKAGVHLLEIDLLRRGTRVYTYSTLAQVPYLAMLTRAARGGVQAWPIRLQDKLPTVFVPLRGKDKDVLLDLQAAFTAIYDIARYDLTLDYSTTPPPPPLSPQDKAWVRELLK